ncbi:MAG: hypothetical protein CMF62_02375 [Magnetococcales bacterium]|nr:hypothetical protein [Magnetococcales bacterium]|tara:strand:+ start:21248 stop:21583 length:336 start_codon:yes stop_codon:yes gene_type:complete
MNYVDLLMVNREPSQKIKGNSSIDTDYYNSNYDTNTEFSLSDNKSQNKIKGGNISNKPHGGFPLLFQLEKDNNQDPLLSENEISKREQAIATNNVNISDIMSKRREVKPFL